MSGKFTYHIAEHPDLELYERCIAKLKSSLAVTKETRLHDVDDSRFAVLVTPAGKVTVKNSEYLDSLHVESEFDLSGVFDG